MIIHCVVLKTGNFFDQLIQNLSDSCQHRFVYAEIMLTSVACKTFFDTFPNLICGRCKLNGVQGATADCDRH